MHVSHVCVTEVKKDRNWRVHKVYRWKGERKRERDSLLIRTRHRLGYRLGVYRRCMESGTNTVGNVPSLRMMDDRGRLYRQTIWKSRYGGGSNSIWWNGESKAARREGEVFANGPVLRNVRLLEGWFCLMKLLLEIIIFLWIEIELVFFFFFSIGWLLLSTLYSLVLYRVWVVRDLYLYLISFFLQQLFLS